MNESALNFLVCPRCGGPVRFVAHELQGNEVEEGELSCRCGGRYPVRQGVPEFVEDAYTDSFSFQWRAQHSGPENEALAREVVVGVLSRMEVDPQALAGRRVLDAGCGRGVLVELMANHGAEAAGIDMSDGIWVAASRMKGRPNAHLLRGDILHPPIADGSFDAVFSFGVLHHTRDCRAAFLRLARLLRPGGIIGIWLYSAYGRYRYASSDLLRRATTRMPPRLLYALCHLAVPLNALQQIPILGLPFRIIPVAGDGPWRWVVLGTYDWYSPRYQSKHTFPEVFRWFEEAGLERIRVHDVGIGVTGRRPN